jgi:hypothetical protein
MKNYILSLIFLLSINLIPQSIQTPLERNEFQKLTSYDEMKEFIYRLDESSDLISTEVIGNSCEGRNLYAMKFSNSEFGKDGFKIKILIFAQQHGNEQSGKEGSLLLANELLKEENRHLFEKIDFLLIPQMNPDGSERNQRRNGNGVDLNRNHLILTEPETIALHKLFDRYHFDVTMDVHEYWPYSAEWKKYGFRRNFDVTVGAITNINISSEIRKLSYESYLPFIFKYISERGFSAFHYLPGGPPESAYLRYSTFDINDGRQSFGILNTFSFIQEGMNGENYGNDNIELRAKGQMTGMLGLLQFSYYNREKIKNLVSKERDKLIYDKLSEKVAIHLAHFSDGNELNLQVLSYYSNNDTIVTVNNFRPVVKSLLDIKRPQGYLIPKEITELRIWLENHSIQYTEPKAELSDKLEQYFIERIDSIDFEGDIIINPYVTVSDVTGEIDISKYFFIPTSQLKNNMIVIALEPKSMLGIVTYKQFEYLLTVGEKYRILRLVNY